MNKDKHLPSPEVVDWLLDQKWSDVIPITTITYPKGNPDGVTKSERFDYCSATVAIGADECCHLQLPIEALEVLRSDQQARRVAIEQKRAAMMPDELKRKRARDETRKGEEFPMPPDLIRRAAQLEQEAEKLLSHFRSASDGASAMGLELDSWAISRAAALLQQQEAEINRLRAQQAPVPVIEREATAIEALKRLRRWGRLSGGGYSADVVLGVVDWIDGGMVGELPPLPAHVLPMPQGEVK